MDPFWIAVLCFVCFIAGFMSAGYITLGSDLFARKP